MNQALAGGREEALLLRKWMVRSDAPLDPQAWILSPQSAIHIGKAIVGSINHYDAGRAAGMAAINLMRDAHQQKALRIDPREIPWLDRMQDALESLPADEGEFISLMMTQVDTTKFEARDYGL